MLCRSKAMAEQLLFDLGWDNPTGFIVSQVPTSVPRSLVTGLVSVYIETKCLSRAKYLLYISSVIPQNIT